MPTKSITILLLSITALFPAHFTNGAIVQKLDYLPFGAERVNARTDAFDTKFTFTDQENDPESGLLYYGARYYHPTLGRFIEPDPVIIDTSRKEFAFALQNPQLLNGYSYVGNNPVRYVDEEGEVGILAPALAAGGGYFLATYGQQIGMMLPAVIDNPGLAAQAVVRTAPITGDAIDITEALSGYNALTGEQLTQSERTLTRLSVSLPIVSGALLRNVGKTEAAQGLVKTVNRWNITRQLDNLSGKTVNGIEVPKGWDVIPSKDTPGGYRYIDPANEQNHIRVMPGNPKSPNPSQQVPYMKIHTAERGFIDLNGNRVERNTHAAHIPIKTIR